MIERDNNGLPPELHEATRLLRELPAPSDLWRQRLLREIEAASPPRIGGGGGARGSSGAGRRWSMRPATAIAAGLACALLGAGTVAIARRDATPRTITERVPASSQARVRFTFVAPAAARVSIVGDFNGWNPNALPLRRSSDGSTWEVEVPLAPGRYAYAFIVDGALARDPSAPQAPDDDFGSANSVVMVRGS